MFRQAQSCNALRHARSEEKTREKTKAKARPRRLRKTMDAGYGSYFEERDLFSSVAMGSRSKTALWIKKKKKKGGANFSSTVHPKESALHTACTAGQQKIVSLLLKRGAHLHATDAIGNTAMHRCARHCQIECAKLLLEQKPDWQERNMDGLTALQIAGRHGHQEMVLLLHATR